MKLGGVIFASLGILVTVLVANGRWSTVWAAMLGSSAGSGASSNSGAPNVSPIPGYNYGPYTPSTDPNAAGNNP